MNKTDIYSFTLQELKQDILQRITCTEEYRAKQIFQWLYVRYENDFNGMNNLSKELRTKLDLHYAINPISILKTQESKDGSIKYLFGTRDNHTFEGVFLPMGDNKFTFCISSQVGCKMGCSFCLTAKGGFIRNLSVAEIVAQVVLIKKHKQISQNKAINIVFMGMGEPLDNFNHVIAAINIFKELDGLSIATRRQTISTSGIAPKIAKLGALKLGVQLAISLHAVDDKLRNELMPINHAYNISHIIKEIREFPLNTRKRIMFEYLMIEGLNDSLESAKKLVKLLANIKAKVNLIYFNPYPGSPYNRPSTEKMEAFREFLLKKGLLCTIRESKGLDISAACGQLREQNSKTKTFTPLSQ